ncbi:30S ribosomal protein S16 [Candidatus Berkelbacteria bacterium CG_4_10_14_0_8_um_filter_35_9_33_8]|uniref:Small ribosomal subunit protein bS16 n=1 Tax=Candidatus Berkelbacteria bacterium CG_4_10_14_0_2_um_filter_35_9_33_12 TaxID=1974499 RepID=A0A2M7W3K9_9BACT|nr:MAG: 30S ribosomal protein S16 [Candidatus Berkelbacteria bacterium CG23_combo_of_CG06-09_8_20_14_all_33_15]PIS08401.1 MAG: 30S ribosomal protein S16 [Candidatus Berkelbacteria bacterium CG10_big_fil_rev_8_21_14_0_10_33_10]PIZ27931.1 MAG: 30S ribosomal protein S16 [Candidatus Berkelbacteria bacterium CG_4_10_14_0_8_um_filter_35_9_33_8]PJA20088.1 MAG: 30S ribosomal protein S16 [Candidatus Berkelbacteria bacterium CG_4_10_14_0_2_um_filter_35_9_33_12]
MLKIRLQRVGRRNLVLYRIVVAEQTAPVKGKFIAKIGTYNPKTKIITLNKEAVLRWLNFGAQPTNTISKLFKKEKIEHKLISVHTFNKKVKKKKDSDKKTNNQLNSPMVESEINKDEKIKENKE